MQSNSKTVLLIDETHSVLPEKLKAKGYIVDFFPQYNYDDVLNNIAKYDCIVVRSKVKIDKAIIDRWTEGDNSLSDAVLSSTGADLQTSETVLRTPRVRCIARSGAGMDAIDVDYAQSKGIRCLNSPEGNRDAVAEHTLGLLLSLFNKINFADSEVRKGLWQREENRGVELKGKTVGIIGYGNMGQAFAKRLTGFGCHVIAYDKYKKNYITSTAKSSENFFSDGFSTIEEVTLEELFERTDVLSLHVPLTSETFMMVNERFIDKFAKPFYLLNTSRGKVVSLHALAKALQSGKVLGCGLDVSEAENYNQQFVADESLQKDTKLLYGMKNTVFTPHVAGWTTESYFKLADYLADKITATLG